MLLSYATYGKKNANVLHGNFLVLLLSCLNINVKHTTWFVPVIFNDQHRGIVVAP